MGGMKPRSISRAGTGGAIREGVHALGVGSYSPAVPSPLRWGITGAGLVFQRLIRSWPGWPMTPEGGPALSPLRDQDPGLPPVPARTGRKSKPPDKVYLPGWARNGRIANDAVNT